MLSAVESGHDAALCAIGVEDSRRLHSAPSEIWHSTARRLTLTIDLPDEQNTALAAKARAHGCRRMKDVPTEDFAALPKDGLSQIDHYVHGVPKKTP